MSTTFKQWLLATVSHPALGFANSHWLPLLPDNGMLEGLADALAPLRLGAVKPSHR